MPLKHRRDDRGISQAKGKAVRSEKGLVARREGKKKRVPKGRGEVLISYLVLDKKISQGVQK